MKSIAPLVFPQGSPKGRPNAKITEIACRGALESVSRGRSEPFSIKFEALAVAMESSPRGSQPEEESDYEPGLALPEDPYSPADSGSEEDLDEQMSVGSLGAAEVELWTEAPEKDSAEEQLLDPEEAMSLSEPEAASEDSEDSDEEDEEEPAPKRRRLRGKQSAPEYGPPLYPELLAQLRGPRPVAKKKAARKPKKAEHCRGYDGEACVFSPQRPGEPARTQPKRGENHCLFCKAEKLQALLPARRANRVTQALKKLKAADEEIFRKAVDRIRLFTDEDKAKDFAARGSTAKRQPTRPKPSASWTDCLQRRRVAGQGLSRKRRAAYQAAVEKDKRLARRKIFYPERLLKRAGAEEEEEEKAAVIALGLESQVAFNDAELPAPKDPTAKMVEAWCKQGAWGICASCGSLCPRPLRPMDLRRAAKPTIPKGQCSACRSGAYVPQPEDIPAACTARAQGTSHRSPTALGPRYRPLPKGPARLQSPHRHDQLRLGCEERAGEGRGPAQAQRPEEGQEGAGPPAERRGEQLQDVHQGARGLPAEARAGRRGEAAQAPVEVHRARGARMLSLAPSVLAPQPL